jgi:hypothetical protein
VKEVIAKTIPAPFLKITLPASSKYRMNGLLMPVPINSPKL